MYARSGATMMEMAWCQHKRVVGGRGSGPYITADTLVGVYHRVDLYPAFLLSGLGMTPHTFENHVGKERNGGETNDTEQFYPLFRTVTAAVRGKFSLLDP